VAKLERWVAKLGRWVAKLREMGGQVREWVAKLGRWVAKLVREMDGELGSAPACYGSSLGSNPDNSQEYKMGDISKGVANTLQPVKKYTKKDFSTMRHIFSARTGIH
jgi:hypothetical protein